MTEKLDLVREHPEAYTAPRAPSIVEIGAGTYLTITGAGKPGDTQPSAPFARALSALYGLAYTLKFACKARGQDFKVPPLEASWWSDVGPDLLRAPPETWRWKARLRLPDFVTADDVDAARATLREKRKEGDFDQVVRERIQDGACVQVMHVGPYAEEQPTIEAMHRYAAEAGYALRGQHHEVYLSDPNRTRPERMRTILRQPVQPAAPNA